VEPRAKAARRGGGLWALLEWLGDKLRRRRRDSGSDFVRANLHALERACDPETNPRLSCALEALGIESGTRGGVSELRTWTLRRVPRGANKLLRAHWSVRRREEKDWRLLIRSVCGRPPAMVESRVRLEVTIHRLQLQDPDNAYASLKPLLDALVREGWLRDYSSQWLELDVQELVESDRRRCRTEIVWRKGA